MNSTLKSLVFWMALVVIGVLVWNFSTRFSGASSKQVEFSAFMTQVDSGQVQRESEIVVAVPPVRLCDAEADDADGRAARRADHPEVLREGERRRHMCMSEQAHRARGGAQGAVRIQVVEHIDVLEFV